MVQGGPSEWQLVAPLTWRVAGFIDHLRMNDFVVGPAETQAALTVLSGQLSPLSEARTRLKILLTSSREEWTRFDDLFEAYWRRSGRERAAWQSTGTADSKSSAGLNRAWRDHLGQDDQTSKWEVPQIESEGQGQTAGDATGRLIASDKSTRMTTDFRQFVDPAEIAEAEQLAYRLARAIRYRLSRRYRIANHGAQIDLRRTIRDSLARGGEPIDLARKARPDRPVRIVVFLDVSGSMKHYSRFFMQFVKGLVCEWFDTDAYLFHTRLIRVTEVVKEKNAMRAMARLSLMADGFGGGTKLGESLEVFNDRYAKRALNSRSVVIILSDGYDTGSAEQIVTQLKRIRKRARHIIWLNPLLGWRDYEPVTRAMSAAMPYIDHFAAANTLQSLAAVEPELARL